MYQRINALQIITGTLHIIKKKHENTRKFRCDRPGTVEIAFIKVVASSINKLLTQLITELMKKTLMTPNRNTN